jgi:outer membrane protein assembly factor BamB
MFNVPPPLTPGPSPPIASVLKAALLRGREEQFERAGWKPVLLAFVAVIAFATTVHAGGPANWPQFRGPTGQGHAAGAELPLSWSETENITWKTPLPGRGHSSPVIWGDQIWLTVDIGAGEQLGAVCLDRTSGEMLREVTVFEPSFVLPIHDDNNYASPTPAIEADRLYVHYGRYGTACIDTTNGEVLWRTHLVIEHQGGPGSSPVLFEDLLIVNCDGADFQYVVALDTADGSIRWKTERSAPQRDNPVFKRAFSTPLIVQHEGRTVLISIGADQTHAYDPATGEEVWHVRYVGFSNVAAPVADEERTYLITGYYGPEVLAVGLGGRGNVSSTHIAWRYKGAVPETPSPLLAGGRLYLVSNSGVASAVDVTSEKRLWLKRLGGNFAASPITDGRHVYFCGSDGRTHVVSLEGDLEVIAVNQLDGRLWASPAVSGNALYLRTDAAVYRIESR